MRRKTILLNCKSIAVLLGLSGLRRHAINTKGYTTSIIQQSHNLISRLLGILTNCCCDKRADGEIGVSRSLIWLDNGPDCRYYTRINSDPFREHDKILLIMWVLGPWRGWVNTGLLRTFEHQLVVRVSMMSLKASEKCSVIMSSASYVLITRGLVHA